MKFKRGLSVILVLSFVFSMNIMSATQPTLKKIFADVFTVSASAVDDVITKYAPSGTRDLAVDATVTASSSYTSGTGQWDLARINDGSLVYNGGEFGYNGNAGFTSSPDEIYYHPDNMTQEEKDAAVAESKIKPLTIDFDLEGFYDVSCVALFRHGAFPDSFEIKTSSDGVNYTTVATKSGYAGFSQEALAVDCTPSTARYVRVYVTVRGNLDGNYIHLVQLGEIAVFGTPTAPTNSGIEINTYAPENCINLAIDSKVTASESYEEGEKWGVHNINDGDTQRQGGYTSEPVNRPMQIDFDLGNVAELKRIVIFPNGVAPKTFEIQTACDGVTYKTVTTESITTLYPNSPIVFELPATTFASYVRIKVTERYASESYYVQFAEMAVYGIKNAYNAQLNKSRIKLTPGDTLQLEWAVENLNSFDPYTHNIVWSSTDTSVATVSSNGLVTAKTPGETTVRVENKTIGYYAEAKVNVYSYIPFAREEMTVSVFAPPLGKLFTDEQYKRLADADVDLVLNTYNVYTTEDNLALLEMTEKHGMNAIVADMRLRSNTTTLTKEEIEAVYADYKGISNLEGFYLYDEPWNANDYKNTANYVSEIMPGGFIYLNFFPGFAYTSYEQYEYILEDLASITNGNVDLMFDVYPFMADGTTNYNRLFDSLDAVRRAGLKFDVNTAGCVQTIGYGPVGGPLTNRIPYEADIRYQNMAYLAYGLKHVSYWKYSSEEANGQENYTECAIDSEGNPTSVYYYMQKVNPVVHTLGKTLINCDAQEVYVTGSNTYGQKPVPSGFFVQSADSSQSLILSYLTDRSTGRNYLMVVNNNLSSSVTAPLKFASGIGNVEILNNDTGAWSSSAVSGNYNVNLLPGGAALIALPDSYRYAGTPVDEPYKTNDFYHKTVSGDSSLGTPGVRAQNLPGWYLNALTDGYITANTEKGINGWCSELKDESFDTYVQLDLGSQQSFSEITLHGADESTGYNAYFPKAYTVSVSADGKDWTQVVNVTNSNVNDEVTHPFNTVSARYVRVDITEMNAIDGKYAAALSEIETKGIPQISGYKVVSEDANGFYAYMICENTTHIKVPAWTDNNGQDDIIWHEGEAGSWTVEGKNYNFRAYVPVSQHNNERGTYQVHLYAYNSFTETSKGTTFSFDLKVTYDLNYGGIPKNLMNSLNNISGGSGVTATYNAEDDSIILNGTLIGSINLQAQMPIDAQLKGGDTLRVTVEQISGSMENGLIVLELFSDSMKNPGGMRHVADVVKPGVYDIPIASDAVADEIDIYKLWLYKSDSTIKYNNFRFRIKLEVYNGTDSVYSPSGKTIAYGETFGTLPTPTREDADFLGWFTEPVGGTQITSSSINTSSSSAVLYAQWKSVETELLFGLYPGITADELESKYLGHTNVTYEYTLVNNTKHLGSGTLVDVRDNSTGKVIAKYNLVIVGDVNGDSWYDGQDAVLASAIADSMLGADDIGEAKFRAADCDHDGDVDFYDIRTLNQAGLLLESIDQNLPILELETMSEWQEYIDLIDQTPENEEDTPEIPEEEPCFIARVFELIVVLFKGIFLHIF